MTKLNAITITGYDATVHDRFNSGFPLAPIANSNPNFIGSGLDFSGIGWSTTIPGGITNNSYKGLGMLSPIHFLTAQHYEYPQVANQDTRGIRIRQQNGTTVTSEGVTSIDNLALGVILPNGGIADYDLAVGTLDSPIAPNANFSRLAVLDLYDSSTDDSRSNALSKYDGLTILLYGRAPSENGSPRVIQTTVFDIFDNTNDTDQRTLQMTQNEAAFVLGDSASPLLKAWSNPNGTDELTILGVNSLTANIGGTNYNFSSFFARPGAITGANNAMNPAGFALRCVGDPDYTWVGSSSTRIDRNSAWGIGGNPNASGATSDRYVLFDPATASSSNPTVQTNYNLRGLYFKSTVSTGDGFTFSGGSTLTIGRGGITNYDNSPQTFANNLTLGASQFWAIEDGSVSLAALNTNANFLEVGGGGDVTVTGAISGSGGLAISEGTLTLSGNSSYTGSTWAHGGTLLVSGDIANSAALIIQVDATLTGSGSVPLIQGDGRVSPGNSPGILTAKSINPTDGLDFDFEFTAAAPLFNNAAASVNDLIRITDATPFTNPLDSSNTVRVFLDTGTAMNGQTFTGGFFSDTSADFIDSISEATLEVYVLDGGGSVQFGGQTYSPHTGLLIFTLSTVTQNADFGQGPVAGRIMQLTVEPDQTQYAGWKVFHNLTGNDALNDADTDFDGIEQLKEFAFGGDPNENDLSILPTFELIEDTGSTYLEISLTRPIGIQGIIYTPQTTTDLANWPTNSNGIVSATPTPVDNGDGTETLTYRRSQSVETIDEAFIRIQISETP